PAPIADRGTVTPLGPGSVSGIEGSVAANTDITVHFPPAQDGNHYRPIVALMSMAVDPTQGVDPQNLLGAALGKRSFEYSNMPTSGPELLKFITEDPSLDVTIPGKHFQAPGCYLVLVATARLNIDTSDNLFVGSGAIAGAANAFIVEVPTPSCAISL